MNEKEKIINLLKQQKVFPEEVQKKLGRDRAVVYSVFFLENLSIEATFQRICVVAQKLFPESFSFPEFPEFPDSRIVRNCLWHCVHKSKGWLIGSDKTKYELSESGKSISLEIEQLNKKGMNINNLPLKLRKKDDLITKPIDNQYILLEIKNSGAYKKFLRKKELEKLDIILSLGGDRYSSKEFLENQLTTALEKAKIMNEDKIILYLLEIKKNWGKYFK